MKDQKERAKRAAIIRQSLKDRDLSLSWLARRIETSTQYVSAATRPPFTELSEAFFARCKAVYSKVPVIVGQGKR